MKVIVALAVLLATGLLMPGCPKSGTPHRPDVPDGNDLPPAVKSIEDVESPALADFYGSFADVLNRDTDIVKTTGQFRTAYTRAGVLAFQKTEINAETKLAHPNLAAEIDAIMVEWLGLDDVLLTPERRTKAVTCLRAISDALR